MWDVAVAHGMRAGWRIAVGDCAGEEPARILRAG